MGETNFNRLLNFAPVLTRFFPLFPLFDPHMIRRSRVSALLACTLVVAFGCHSSEKGSEAPATKSGSSKGGGSTKGGGGAAIAVVLGQAQKRDTPIFLDAIGTVSPFNTVTVRTQIDGRLDRVAFQEGQDVKTGDLLAVVDPRPWKALLDQAKAKKAEDVAQLDNAKLSYERNSALGAKGMVGQQAVDAAKAQMDQFTATVQADDASIEQAEVQLGYTEIRAPFDGRVGIRQMDLGNIVHPSDPNGIVVLIQLKPISVILTLPQQNWPLIQKIMAKGSSIGVEALGDENTSIGQGKLSVADNQIDSTTGTIRLKATFPNESLSLWPGQFVNVRVLVETRKDAVVVPSSVVQRGPQGTYAFVVGADSTVEPRLLKVGQIDGGFALIESGLKDGETVVVDGQYKLQSGSSVVAATTAAASPGDGGPKAGKKKKT